MSTTGDNKEEKIVRLCPKFGVLLKKTIGGIDEVEKEEEEVGYSFLDSIKQHKLNSKTRIEVRDCNG